MKTNQPKLKRIIAAATGSEKADLVLKRAKIINVFSEEIISGDLAIADGVIVGIGCYDGQHEIDCSQKIIAPGFIDAHVHIESSMVTPAEFARAVLPSGTTTVIADPHEIVNMGGSIGLDYLLRSSENIPLNVFVMLPAAVPASSFETNGGGAFLAADMTPFLAHPRILGLGEVMCFPDVLRGDAVILDKLLLCRDRICDGHAPGLSGKSLQAYAAAGIETDHEATTFAEAYEKLTAGQWILVREGSAAKNLRAIITGLLESGLPTERFLFCTDDKHLADIHRDGHIRWNIQTAIELGLDPIKAIKMATRNTAQAYGLKRLGAIAPGYRADLVLLSDLHSVIVETVYKDGQCLDAMPSDNEPATEIDTRLLDSVHLDQLTPEKIALPVEELNHIIELIPDQIETNHLRGPLPAVDGHFVPNHRYAKLCVIERHRQTGNVGVAAITGFAIQQGAIATTVAHDSHNIIVVGDNDVDILLAVKTLSEIRGGYVVVSKQTVIGTVPLPVAGLMSLDSGENVQQQVTALIAQAHALGIPTGVDPFITLSFMALPVIPALRLTDRGLFDVGAFELIDKTPDQP